MRKLRVPPKRWAGLLATQRRSVASLRNKIQARLSAQRRALNLFSTASAPLHFRRLHSVPPSGTLPVVLAFILAKDKPTVFLSRTLFSLQRCRSPLGPTLRVPQAKRDPVVRDCRTALSCVKCRFQYLRSQVRCGTLGTSLYFSSPSSHGKVQGNP